MILWTWTIVSHSLVTYLCQKYALAQETFNSTVHTVHNSIYWKSKCQSIVSYVLGLGKIKNIKDCFWKQRTHKITKIEDSVWLSLIICNTVVCEDIKHFNWSGCKNNSYHVFPFPHRIPLLTLAFLLIRFHIFCTYSTFMTFKFQNQLYF